MKHYIAQNIKRDYRIRARLRFRNVAKSEMFLELTDDISLIQVFISKYSLQIICINTKPLALIANVAFISESPAQMKSPIKNLMCGFGLVQ